MKKNAVRSEHEQTIYLAITDHLTGLYNRRHFDACLKKMIDKPKNGNGHFALVMLDLDDFKIINDQHGHLAGDRVLVNLARALKSSVRKVDTCFRYGGDEIAIILPNTDRTEAENIITRSIRQIENQIFCVSSSKISLKLSTGVAAFPDDAKTYKSLVKKADNLLYHTKRQRKKHNGLFILKTKLIPPILKQNLVYRQRLIAQLDGSKNKRLIQIIADAGYGKTTLLAQFARGLGYPYVWYQVDESDNYLDFFMRYLIEGMKIYSRDFGKRTMALLNGQSTRETNLEMLFGTFINELIELKQERIFLFFDDLHEVSDSPEIISGLEYLLNHLPPNVSIVIAARSNPPLSLEKLLFKNETFSLSSDDLKFNKKEIEHLCKKSGEYEPNPNELAELKIDSEGWITSLQFLIPLSRQKAVLTKPEKSRIDRLDDYFEKEVFSSLDENTKLFLAATSVFEQLSSEACDFLLSRNDSQKILRELNAKSLFISAYETPQLVYRYHRLFRDFLVAQLKKMGHYAYFQNRAGKYWSKKNDVLRAITHYSEAKNLNVMTHILEKYGHKYVRRGKVRFVSHYLEQIPKVHIENNPALMITKGAICAHLSDWKNAERYFTKAKFKAKQQEKYHEYFHSIALLMHLALHMGKNKRIVRQAKAILDSKKLKSRSTRARILYAMGIALEQQGKAEKGLAVAKKLLSLARKTNDPFMLHDALDLYGGINTMMGNYADAQQGFEQIIERIPKSPVTYGAWCNLANVMIQQGNLVKAKEACLEGLKNARLYNDQAFMCWINTMLASIMIYNNELEKAEEKLQKAYAKATETGNSLELSEILYYLAETEINRNNFFEALQYYQKALEFPATEAFTNILLTAKAQAEISLHDLDAAKKSLGKVLPRLKTSKHLSMFYYLQKARLMLLEKKEVEAKEFFEKAIMLAEKNSYDFFLTIQLKQCPDILRFLKKISITSPYLQSILAKMPYQEIFESQNEPASNDYDFVIRLFGKFQLHNHEDKIKSSFGWHIRQELFSYIATNPQVLTTREKIMHAFWPEHGPRTAQQLLHNALYWMRKAIAQDIIVFKDSSYQLSARFRCWIDTQEFERLVNDGTKSITSDQLIPGLIKLEEAASLYRGEFMTNFYGEWCQEKRRVYEEMYLNTLQRLADGHYKLGNYEKALKFSNLFINKNPYHEEVYQLTMKCHDKLHDHKGLQDCYAKLKENLNDGLKTQPEPGTTRLFEKLTKTQTQ